MGTTSSPLMNCVIGGLPNDVQWRWAQHLETIRLPEGLALHEPGHAMGFAHFPDHRSYVYRLCDGRG